MAEGELPFSSWRVGVLHWGALLLLLFLSPGLSETSSTYLYSEVVEPMQLETRSPYNSKEYLTYVIKVEGQHRVVQLKQQFFITENMPIYTYNMKGELVAEYPYVQDNCYYSGHVDGVPSSQVVLSTCHGLWGHIQIGNLRYEIQPIGNSPTFQHFIYRKAPEPREPCRGTVEDGADLASRGVRMVDPDGPGLSTQQQDDLNRKGIRYLEYYAVADKSALLLYDSNETLLVSVLFHMMLNVHTVFLPLGLHVYLVGMELWTEKNYVTIESHDISVTLNAFYKYVRYQLRHHVRFDHAGLMTATGTLPGFSWGERLCHHSHVSVTVIHMHKKPRFDAETIAHELGHSLGFTHDDAPMNSARKCDCNCTVFGSCLMLTSGEANCSRLSNCSTLEYLKMIKKPEKTCLLNKPAQIFNMKECGNGVIDGDDEECDCGIEEEIKGTWIQSIFLKQGKQRQLHWMQRFHNQYLFPDHLQSKTITEEGTSAIKIVLMNEKYPTLKGPNECRKNGCCQKDCTFRKGIECLYGLCCEKCKFSEAGTMCREATTECDLPEFCNGSSSDCPIDVYKQDGTPCRNHNHCFLGLCLDLHAHCQALFGQGTREAPLSCFKEMNMRGDRFGNCGKNGSAFRKCPENITCLDTSFHHVCHVFLNLTCLKLCGLQLPEFPSQLKSTQLQAALVEKQRFDVMQLPGPPFSSLIYDLQESNSSKFFLSCSTLRDVLCGRVQCVDVGRISSLATGQGVVQTPVAGTMCWGTEFDLGEDIYDLGAVRDGTTCGPGKICINRACVGVDVLNYDCDLSVCSSRGVCNSNQNCHCSYGWAPPFCIQRGFGGSIDSGPPPPYQIPTIVIVGLVTLIGLVLLAVGVFISRHSEFLNSLVAALPERGPKKSASKRALKGKLSKTKAHRSRSGLRSSTSMRLKDSRSTHSLKSKSSRTLPSAKGQELKSAMSTKIGKSKLDVTFAT